MSKLIIFVVLIDLIFVINSYENLCTKETYVIPLFSTQYLRMKFNQTRFKQLKIEKIQMRAKIADENIADLEDHHSIIRKEFYFNRTNRANLIYNLVIHGKYMDKTYLHYSIKTFHRNNFTHQINCSITISISQPQRIVDKIFKITIPYIIIFISIQMGMLLNVEVLKELFRRPIQAAIGFVCQYILMPLIAYSITKIFSYPPGFGLGLFVVGCCPGGTQSNQWTIVFDGDLNLSAFMSFASTIASFFMMPLWLYTLGQAAYLRELKIYIPFWNLIMSLLTIIIPLGIGMLIVYFFPKLKLSVEKIVKPMLIVLICYFFVFGAFVNFYLRNYFSLRIALSAPLLPWLGFTLGGFFAWIFRQDWKRMLTIGIETGIQNIGVAIMVLLYSLPPPENSRTTVIPIIVAFLSPLPFYLVLLLKLLRSISCQLKKKPPPLRPRISIDTLSKTTHHLSEFEGDGINSTELQTIEK